MPNKTILEQFKNIVEQFPDHVALKHRDRMMTYDELNRKSNQLARLLIASNVEINDSVLLFLEPSFETIIAIIAVLKCGANYVPIDTESPFSRCLDIIEDIKPKCVISLEACTPIFSEITIPLVILDNFDICNDSNLELAIDTDIGAYVIYTSGTTGKPKGVKISHKNLNQLFDSTKELFGFNQNDIVPLFHSYNFDFSVWEIFSALLYGGKLIIVDRSISKNSIEFLRLINKEKVTILNQTPSAFNSLSATLERSNLESIIRYIIFGGEKLQPTILKRWYSNANQQATILINMYGITETTVHTTYYRINYEFSRQEKSIIGKPLPGLQCLILDENYMECDIGSIGTLFIVGDAVSTYGYVNNPELTAEKFPMIEFNGKFVRAYNSGDLGCKLYDGNIQYIGRKDDQIKISGFRIEPSEVEFHLNTISIVEDSLVIKEEAASNSFLKAYIQLTNPMSTDDIDKIREMLKAELHKTLPSYAIPSLYEFIDAIPITLQGKKDRTAFTNSRKVIAVQNDSTIEKICTLISQSLGIGLVKPDDNYFNIGGHSLSAMQFIAEIYEEFEVEIELHQLFNHPTPILISELIDASLANIRDKVKHSKELDFDKSIPATKFQNRIWFTSKLNLSPEFSNILVPFLIEGDIQLNKLVEVIQELTNSTAILRTIFNFNDCQLEQFALKNYDISKLVIIDRISERLDADIIDQYISSKKDEQFDLEDKPAWRIYILKSPNNKTIIFFVFHHIIMDGWSLQILLKTISAMYSNNCKIICDSNKFFKYCEYERTEPHQSVIKKQLDYWKSKLTQDAMADIFSVSNLRSHSLAFDCKTICFSISSEIIKSLESLAAQHNVTLFTILLVIFQLSLFKFTGHRKFVLGTPIATRKQAELINNIGPLINILPIVLSLEETIDIKNCIKGAQGILKELHQNCAIPFDDIVKELELSGAFNKHPVFQIYYSYEEDFAKFFNFDSLTVKSININKSHGFYDLSFNLIKNADGALECKLSYLINLFQHQRIEDLCQTYQSTMKNFISEFDDKIQPKQQINKTKNILSMFQHVYQSYNTSIAVSCSTRQLTYDELDQYSNQIASYMCSIGITRNDVVGVYGRRNSDLLASILAIFKLGATYLPLDINESKERLEWMITDTQAKAVIIINAQFPLDKCQRIFLNKISLSENFNSYSAEVADVAYIIYTSGTTGKPKGVMVSHEALHGFMMGMLKLLSIDQPVSFYATSQITFDISLLEFLLPILTGGICYISPFQLGDDIAVLRNFLNSHSADYCQATPSLYSILLDSEWVPNKSLKLICGGEVIPKSLALKLLNYCNELWNMYGPTETTIWASYDKYACGEIVLGKPIPGYDIHLYDGNKLIEKSGISGEIYISGIGLAKGYLNNPELTKEFFLRNNEMSIAGELIYKTGDFGFYDDEGNLRFTGRIDNQIKLRGHRIELQEIESQLNGISFVELAVVEFDKINQKLIAFLKITTSCALDKTDLINKIRDHISNALPSYMTSLDYVLLDRFPVLSSQKINRKKLLEDYYALSKLHQMSTENVDSEINPIINTLWNKHLGVGVQSYDDNFFTKGGHSLLAMHFLNDINKMLELSILLPEFLLDPTYKFIFSKVQKSSSKMDTANIDIDENSPPFNLSASQKRIWIGAELSTNKKIYNVPVIWELVGVVDENKLSDAFKHVIDTYTILKTKINYDLNGDLIQIVDHSLIINLEIMDFTDEILKNDLSSLQILDVEFNLETGPLCSFRYLRKSNQSGYLIVNFHHIIIDGWSIGLLVDEISRCYAGLQRTPNPIKISYKDYVNWERKNLSNDNFIVMKNYWINKLDQIPQSINLPYSKKNAKDNNGSIDSISITLANDIVQRLGSEASHINVSFFCLLMSLWQIVLHKFSNQTALISGTPVAMRQQPQFEQVVGPMINLLPIVSLIDHKITIKEYIHSMQQTLIEAMVNQDVPFEMIVESVNNLRINDVMPLFQTMMVYQPEKRCLLNIGDCVINEIAVPSAGPKYHITLWLRELDGKLTINLEYISDYFDRKIIDKMVKYYQHVIKTYFNDLQLPVSQLSILTEQENIELFKVWNSTFKQYKSKSIVELAYEQAALYPNEVVLQEKQKVLTRKELIEAVNTLIFQLNHRQVKKGDVVAIYMERSFESVIAFLAILRVGAIYLPLNTKFPIIRIEKIVENSNPSLIITSDMQSSKLKTILVAKLEYKYSILDRTPTAIHIDFNLTDPAYLIYTSGSAGEPKGVLCSHLGLTNRIQWMQERFDANNSDNIAHKTSLSFDVSLWEICWPLISQAKMTIVDEIVQTDPMALVGLIDAQQISIIHFVPTFLDQFLNRVISNALQTLKYVFVSGEALSKKLLDRFYQKFRCELHNLYGPTEASIDVTHWPCTANSEQVFIGKPISNMQVLILDQFLQPSATGVVGEIYLGGIGLAISYYNDAVNTNKKFIKNPFHEIDSTYLYRTGDLGYFNFSGNIIYCGRSDFQVKVMGNRVELSEIENCLIAMPEISDAKVEITKIDTNDQLIAFIKPTGLIKENSLIEAIKNHLSTLLPSYMFPNSYIILDEFPLTTSGKCDRKKLIDEFYTYNTHDTAKEETNTVEEAVEKIWKEVLLNTKFSNKINFFDAGGNSLQLIKLQNKLNQYFGIKLSLIELFQLTTIEMQTRTISKLIEVSQANNKTSNSGNSEPRLTTNVDPNDIAVIGLDCRLPGANSIDQFWENLLNGRESISYFSDEELLAENIPASVFAEKNYVKAKGIINNLSNFDYEFFSINKKHADLMDPQHRILLELSWRALDDAGYVNTVKNIGVFVSGNSVPLYLFQNVLKNQAIIENFGLQHVTLSNQLDSLATTISYRLDIHGPSLTLQTACSSSLVAVNYAVKSLINHECEIAIAGGISITLPNKSGYQYEMGSVVSSDGHCRAFDVKADGMVPADGAGVVILKRLSDAIRDKDSIFAVIKGVGINNDGQRKVGFTAPSVAGQSAAILAALKSAKISPLDMSFIETHGTGTVLGDAIEIEALKKVFSSKENESKCALGSVKANIGHTNSAAGIAGLIKTILVLYHQKIPPAINISTINPEFKLEDSCFYINTSTVELRKDKRNYAGVSSFGMGGTNCHIIVSNYPELDFTQHKRIKKLSYEFKNTHCWIQSDSVIENNLNINNTKLPISEWYYQANLEKNYILKNESRFICSKYKTVIVFLYDESLFKEINQTFAQEGFYISIIPGVQYEKINQFLYKINPDNQTDYERLFQELSTTEIDCIIHLWNFETNEKCIVDFDLKLITSKSLQLIYLARVANRVIKNQKDLYVVTGDDYHGMLINSLTKAIDQECVTINIRQILFDKNTYNENNILSHLKNEIFSEKQDKIIFYKNYHRNIQSFQKITLEEPLTTKSLWANDSTYILTGGLGEMAKILIDDCIKANANCKIILLCRSFNNISRLHAYQQNQNIHALEVDIADANKIIEMLSFIKGRFPSVKGIFHLAGNPGESESQFLENVSADIIEFHLKSKLKGLQNIITALKDEKLEFIVCMSSLAAHLGGAGLLAYALANNVMNQFCDSLNLTKTIKCYSINWDNWDYNATTNHCLHSQEGLKVINAIMQNDITGSVIISISALKEKTAEISNKIRKYKDKLNLVTLPELSIDYTDSLINEVWQCCLDNVDGKETEDFYELGGDSFTAIAISQRLSQGLNLSISPYDILNYSSIDRLRTFIKSLMQGLPNKQNQNPMTDGFNSTGASTLPLSSFQKRIWLSEIKSPNTALNNMPYGFNIQGKLNINTLEEAFKMMIQRYDALRTAIMLEDLEPSQKIFESINFNIREFSYISYDPIEESKYIRNSLEVELQTPFVLSHAPLIRAQLHRLNNDRFVLLVFVHHIVTDGYSMNIFFKELAYIYNAIVNNTDSQLPKINYSYTDFIKEQYGSINESQVNRGLAYWKSYLNDIPTIINIKTDRKRTANVRYAGNCQFIQLDSKLSTLIKEQAQLAHVTLFTYVLAIYHLFLHHLTGQSTTVVGIPTNARHEAHTKSIFGFFVNTLPIKAKFESIQSFSQYLDEFKIQLMECFKHQNIPFDQIVEVVKIPSSSEHDPIFQTAFSLQPKEQVQLLLQNLYCTSLEDESITQQRMSRTDLYFILETDEDNLTIKFEYSTALFNKETIQRFLEYIQFLIEQVIRNSSKTISEFKLLKNSDELIDSANAKIDPTAYNRNWLDLFAASVLQYPYSTALVFNKKRITYKELDNLSNQIATAILEVLDTLNSKTNYISLIMKPCLEYYPIVIAILKLGFAYCPIDYSWPEHRISQAINQLKPSIILVDADSIMLKQKGLTYTVFDKNEIIERGLSKSKNVLIKQSQPSGIAYVIFTSGSTGEPKAVPIVNYALANLARQQIAYFEMTHSSRVIQFANFCFDASVSEWSTTLAVGASLYLISDSIRKNLEDLSKFIRDNAITVATLPPSFLQFLDFEDLYCCKTIVSAGEPCSQTIIDKFSSRTRLINAYGPTECCVCATIHYCKPDDLPNNIGLPIKNISLLILDNYYHPVPKNVVGQIFLGGVGITPGYSTNVNINRESFINLGNSANRFYATGDLARYIDDNCIEYVGRIDRETKLNGYRINLTEIETYIKSSPLVTNCAVKVETLANQTKAIVAYVVLKNTNFIDLKLDINSFLVNYLPSYMLLKDIIVVDEIPITGHGKIDYEKLHLSNDKDTFVQAIKQEYMLEPHQTQLFSIIKQYIVAPELSVNDNYLAFGGDSILSIQIATAAKRLGIKISIKELFNSATILEILQSSKLDTSGLVVPNHFNTDVLVTKLSPIQKWFFSQDLQNFNHWNQSMLFEIVPEVPIEIIEKAVIEVLQGHASVHLRFINKDNEWKQYASTNMQESYQFLKYSFDDNKIDINSAQIKSEILRLQSGLNILNGPIIKLGCFISSKKYLFIAAHHLVIDIVSWKILIAQLQERIFLLMNNISKKTTFEINSYLDYVSYLYDQNIKNATVSKKNSSRQGNYKLHDIDSALERNTFGAIMRINQQIACQSLIRELKELYSLRTEEIVVIFLFFCFTKLTNSNELFINIEGHGRYFNDELAINFSETTGWFTSLTPFQLKVSDRNDTASTILEIKEKLRELKSEDYACFDISDLSLICLNFTGEHKNINNSTRSYLKIIDYDTTSNFANDNIRFHLLDINISIVDGMIDIDWKFSNKHFSDARISAITTAFNEIIDVISKKQATLYRRFSPSDFPNVDINQVLCNSILNKYPIIEDVYYCNPMQSALLTYDFLKDSYISSAYNVKTIFSLFGHVNLERFKTAWNIIIHKHSVLRSFYLTNYTTMPLMIVLKNIEFNIDYLDVSLVDDPQKNENINTFIFNKENFFQLDIPPLFRIRLIKESENSYSLIFSNHHILLDGWSGQLLFDDFFLTYNKLKGEKPNIVASYHYQNYARWLKNRDISFALQFWRDYLHDKIGQCKFNGYYKRHNPSDIDSFQQYQLVFSEDLTKKLINLAHIEKITLNSILQLAWTLLLHIYLQQDAILFAVTISGRNIDVADIDSMIGLFINTVPVCLKLNGDMPIRELAHTIHRDNINIQEYGYLSLSEILSQSTHSNIKDAFDTLFVFESYPVIKQSFSDGDFTITNRQTHEHSEFPITIAIENQFLIRATLTYNSRLFEHEFIERLGKYFERVAKFIGDNISAPIKELSITEQKIINTFEQKINSIPETFDNTQTIQYQFAEIVKKYPNKLAIKANGVNLTYTDIDNLSNKVFAKLRALQKNKIILIAVALTDKISAIITILAAAKNGIAYLPLDTESPYDFLKLQLSQADYPIIIADSTNYLQFKDYKSAVYDYEQLIISDLDIVQRIVVPGNQLAYVMFTSGSTGSPKGVMVENKSIVNLVCAGTPIQISSTDYLALTSNLAFDAATFEVWGALLNGACLVITEKDVLLSNSKFKLFIDDYNITIMWLTAGLFNSLVMIDPTIFQKVTHLIIGGEKLYILAVNRLLSAVKPQYIYNGYGPTEATTFSTIYQICEKYYKNEIPIGNAINNCVILILDRYNNLLPQGIIGEINISGVNLARGYLNDKDIKQNFLENPFNESILMYQTGDLGFYNDDLSIGYYSRKSDFIKRNGYRIDPNFIESMIAKLEQVYFVKVVTAIESSSIKIIALIVSKDIFTSVERAVQQLLPRYMWPDQIKLVHEIPLTRNGKVDISKIFEYKPINNNVECCSSSPLEVEIVNLFKSALEINAIDTAKSFFENGGNSLLLIKLIHTIEREFSIQIDLKPILNGLSLIEIAKLYAQQISEARQTQTKALLKIHENHNNKGSIVFLHPGDGLPNPYYKIASKLTDFNVFVTFDPNIFSTEINISSLEKLATFYVEEILKAQIPPPYYLIGWSFGGALAYEIAFQLLQLGKTVKSVTMFDSFNFHSSKIDIEPLVNKNLAHIKNKSNSNSNDKEAMFSLIEKIMRKNISYLFRYNPPYLRCPVRLIKAIKSSNLDFHQDINYGWGKCSHLYIDELNCEHSEIFDPDLLDQVFKKIIESLNLNQTKNTDV